MKSSKRCSASEHSFIRLIRSKCLAKSEPLAIHASCSRRADWKRSWSCRRSVSAKAFTLLISSSMASKKSASRGACSVEHISNIEVNLLIDRVDLLMDSDYSLRHMLKTRRLRLEQVACAGDGDGLVHRVFRELASGARRLHRIQPLLQALVVDVPVRPLGAHRFVDRPTELDH